MDEEILKKIKLLRQELEEMKRGKSPRKKELLKESLQTTLDLVTVSTGAEKGSLFLLYPSVKIIDAILSREEVTPEKRANLIGKILDKGLVGWVRKPQ